MSSCSTLGDSKGPKNSTSISKSGCIMSSVPLMSKSRQNRWASCKSHALQFQQLSSLLVIHFHICFTELKIYHLSFFHHTARPRHWWSLQFAGRVSNMNLVYGLALHESSVAQVDRAPARCLGGNRFESCWGLRFFICPTFVTCFIFTFVSPNLKFTIFHSFSLLVLSDPG